MKKTYYFVVIAAFIAIIVMPVILRAQIDETPKKTPLRNFPAKIRQELRSDIQERQSNARLNQNIRNSLLENRASTTRMMSRFASSTWATSSVPFREGQNGRQNMQRGEGYLNNGRSMILNIFEIRKHFIVNELERALNNLKNVRGRIQSRIDKVSMITASSTARDMTEAKRLLVIADAKILSAQYAINAIKDLSATSTAAVTASSTTSTTTLTGIDLNRPRLVAIDAQKLIKAAQRALNDVVVAIAHGMGLKLGDTNATTTPTSTNQ